MKRWGYLLVLLWLTACQAKTPTTGSAPLKSEAKPKPGVSEEQLSKARALIRPGTRDHLEFLYNDQQQAVSWMVVYDPPQPIPQASLSPSTDTDAYHTKNLVQFFSDKISYSQVPGCRVASFAVPPNISVSTFSNWYRSQVWSYGGRRNHPDPWIRDDNCRGSFTAKLNGTGDVTFQEERIADLHDYPYSGEPTSSDPLYYIWYASFNSMQLVAPCRSVQHGVDVTLDKTAACDGTSPALHSSAHYQGIPAGGPPGPTPTPTPTPEPYCHRSVQRSLDQEEGRLRQLELDAAGLAAWIGDEDFSFTTQAQFQVQHNYPSPGPYPKPTLNSAELDKAFQVKQFASPSSSYDPSSFPSGGSGGPGPSPTPMPADVVTEQELLSQIHMLENLSSNIENKIDQLESYFKQDYEELKNDPDTDQDSLDTALDYLSQIGQMKNTLKPIQVSIQNTMSSLPFLCSEPEPESVAPQISLIFSAIEPDGTLVVHGRLSGDFENYSPSKIEVDFNGDINVNVPLNPQSLNEDSNRFVIRVPFGDYSYTRDYQTRIVTDGLEEGTDHALQLQKLHVKLGYCETPGCFRTNIIHVHISDDDVRRIARSFQASNHQVNYENCSNAGGIIDIASLLGPGASQVAALNDLEANYNYTVKYIHHPVYRNKACIALDVAKKSGESVAYITNNRKVWQAYNSALLLLGRKMYDVSESKPEIDVEGKDIRLLAHRLYTPRGSWPSNLPPYLFTLIPNTFTEKNGYYFVSQNSKVLQPDTKMRTSNFTSNWPDVENGNIFSIWPTVCVDYKSRLIANTSAANNHSQEKKLSVMLESIGRYHLLSLLMPGSTGSIPSIPHPNAQIWADLAEETSPPPGQGPWESDNLLYQGQSLANGKFSVHVLGIAEAKLGKTRATEQVTDNYNKLFEFKNNNKGITIHGISGVTPSDVKILSLDEDTPPFIKVSINNGDQANRSDLRRLREALDQGVLFASVPETKVDITNLVNYAENGGCP